MLATRLTQSGKFLLFERTNADPILKALVNQSLGGMGLPADFLIVGSLSDFGRKETSDTGVFSRTKKQTTVARVNVRLIDVKTSRVLFADEGAGKAESETGTTLGVGSKAGYDSSLNDAAISAAVSPTLSLMSTSIKWLFCLANSSAMARPIPRLAPVTRTILPSKSGNIAVGLGASVFILPSGKLD